MRIRTNWVAFAFLVLGSLSIPMWCHGMTGDFLVNCSSIVTGVQTIRMFPSSRPGDVLGYVVVSTRSVGYETLDLYDSSATIARPIQSINLSSNTVGGNASVNDQIMFNLRLSTAISYIKTGSNSTAIIYWHSMKGVCQ